MSGCVNTTRTGPTRASAGQRAVGTVPAGSQTDQPVLQVIEAAERSEVLDREPGQVPVTRLVSANGTIGFGAQRYLAARWLSGETVEVLSTEGLVEIVFRGQVIATHARKHDPGKAPKLTRSAPGRRARERRRSTSQ